MYELSSTNHHQNAVETTYQEEKVNNCNSEKVNNSNSQPDAVINLNDKPTNKVNPDNYPQPQTDSTTNLNDKPTNEVHRGFKPQPNPATNSNDKPKSRLNDKHYFECVTKRGLNPEWIQVNCRSMTVKEASDRLGYPAKSEGIWLEGVNGFGQFRPNKPWKNANFATGIPTVGNGSAKNGTGSTESANVPESISSRQLSEKKAPKYRTATGEEYDAMLPRHPHNPRYWEDLVALQELCWKIDGHPCLGITEGMLKAISACANDIPCVALAGVEMGLTPAKNDPQGKRYLVETLEKLARTGFGFIIIFDADAATNQNVVQAQRKLAHQIVKFDVPVYIATGLWSVLQGKGMDDYIQNNGADKFKREVLGKIIDFSAWERQFKDHNSEKETTYLPAKEAAQHLAERYRQAWKHDLKQQVWRRYNDKIWEQTPNEVFAKAVYHDLEAMPNVRYKTYSYVENVVKFLALELQERDWISFNRSEWIAFSDCVQEVSTGKTHEHSPGFMFTSCLEHECPKLKFIRHFDVHVRRKVEGNPVVPRQGLFHTGQNSCQVEREGGDLLELLRINAPVFYSWAMYAQGGDPIKVLKLLAILNGVLTYGFFDMQMFVLLIGVPGSGKGTFARLLERAVGKQNHASAKMHRLGEDNVLASIIDKQLVICPDEKKQSSGDNSGVLVLTGGDSIAYRQIYKPMSNAKFHGALVILANSNPFVGDTTGIDRRWSLVQFDKPLPARDTAVERQMQAEVGVLISLALAMPKTQVTDLIKGTGEGIIPDFKRQQWLHKTDNDSIALFMEEMLVPATADQYLMLGGKGDDPSSLYGAYLKMCDENNARNVYTKNNFRGHLLELCREVGWDLVRESRCGTGWRVYGLRIRAFNDENPRISDWLGGVQTQCRECRPSVDPDVDLKPLPDKDSVGSVEDKKPKNNFDVHHHQQVEGETQIPENNRAEVYTPALSPTDKGLGSTLACTGSTLATDEPTLVTDELTQVGTGSKLATDELTQVDTGSRLATDEPTQVGTESRLVTDEPTLSQQIIANWDNMLVLGQLILAIADTDQLRQEVRNYSPEQINHIKNAAKQSWKPGCNSEGEYCGEKVELMEFGNKRDWKVRSANGSIIPAARGNVRPWLGI